MIERISGKETVRRMYSRSNGCSIWYAILAVAMVAFGGYFVWHGILNFLETRGDITAPATATVERAQLNRTATYQAIATLEPFDFTVPTVTPPRSCQEFYVSVLRARIRKCPDEKCDTLDMPPQNAIICVYGPAPTSSAYPLATEWYEVNLDPDDPLPIIGFMHNSVVDAVNPTKRPTQTPAALPTLTFTKTPRPTITPTPTDTPRPTRTPTFDPSAPFIPAPMPTLTLTPSPTPSSTPRPLRSA